MAFKFIIFAGLLAFANAGLLPVHHGYAASYVQPAPLVYSTPLVTKTLVEPIDYEYNHHPQYDFSYGVQDPHTGDSKSQHEVRDGDVVKGSYSLIDADGTKRTVEYTADDHHGFNAVVHKEPAHYAVKTVAPVVPVVHSPVVQAPVYASLAYKPYNSYSNSYNYAAYKPYNSYANYYDHSAYDHSAYNHY